MVSEQSRNPAHAVSRILAVTLATDASLADAEIRAVRESRLLELLGIQPADFQRILHQHCRDLMLTGDDQPAVSVLELDRIGEALSVLNDSEHRYRSSSRLLELMRDSDPAAVDRGLGDLSQLDEVLDQVQDPEHRLQTCLLMLHLMNADGELHRKEIALLDHVLERWGMNLSALHDALASTGRATN
jgi:uncharacterized tellurite resistance protein B-like protein